MGNVMKWLCYVSAAIALFLSVYTGIVSKERERRKKSISYVLTGLAVLGFFILQFEYNDPIYALPKTLLLMLFWCFIFAMFASERFRLFLPVGLMTLIGFIVASVFGGYGVKYYCREEITKTVEPIEYYHVVKGAWPGNYIFQWGGVIYYYVYDDKTGLVSLDHVMAKDVKEKKFTEYEKDAGDPVIKWHTNMTYYKAPNWGEEVEKEAPALPSLSNYRYYIELIVPEPDWPLN